MPIIFAPKGLKSKTSIEMRSVVYSVDPYLGTRFKWYIFPNKKHNKHGGRFRINLRKPDGLVFNTMFWSKCDHGIWSADVKHYTS